MCGGEKGIGVVLLCVLKTVYRETASGLRKSHAW